MAKRPGAVAVTGGALLVLLCPGVATADTLPSEVTGGYAALTFENQGVSLSVARPAVRGSADRVWFPATGGDVTPETGDADLELGGSALLASATGEQLSLSGLTLRLDGDTGTLHTRTVVAGQPRELDLADVTSGAEPVVRTSGVTWTGLEATLTADGAALLSAWSGSPFSAGDAFGTLDVTVGTGSAEAAEGPEATPRPDPTQTKQAEPEQAPTVPTAPTAAVTRGTLTPGAEQQVTGAGFEPGEVVLVAIDEDTRYQAVADGTGQVARSFPVYDTATEGAHTVELYTVSGGRGAVAEFEVSPNSR